MASALAIYERDEGQRYARGWSLVLSCSPGVTSGRCRGGMVPVVGGSCLELGVEKGRGRGEESPRCWVGFGLVVRWWVDFVGEDDEVRTMGVHMCKISRSDLF